MNCFQLVNIKTNPHLSSNQSIDQITIQQHCCRTFSFSNTMFFLFELAYHNVMQCDFPPQMGFAELPERLLPQSLNSTVLNQSPYNIPVKPSSKSFEDVLFSSVILSSPLFCHWQKLRSSYVALPIPPVKLICHHNAVNKVNSSSVVAVLDESIN